MEKFKIIEEDRLNFGCSSLHTSIKIMEQCLKVAYYKEYAKKHFDEENPKKIITLHKATDDEKAAIITRKKEIQAKLTAKLRITV